MTDWTSLRHAYGSAADVPPLLEAISSLDRDSDEWLEAWDHLKNLLEHQGTVFSASFVALPVFAKTAAQWPASKRGPLLAFAGHILASDDVWADREALLRFVADTIPRLQELCRESLFAP